MQFEELELSCPDLEAARAFYADVLGFAHLPAAPTLTFAAGRTHLILRAAPEGEQPRYHVAFSVPLAGFDAARRRIAARTPLITADGDEVIVHANWDAVACYFRDPAGNILECIARRDEPPAEQNTPETPAIGSVCEVGLVVDDVAALAATLRATLGITPFRGSEGETFTALGDAAGLLIIVRREREWYPSTGLAAAPAPLRIALTLDDGTRRRIAGPPYHCTNA